MNIALLAPRIWNTIFLDQARAWVRQGHQVAVYTEDDRGDSGRRFTRLREDGIDFWIIHGTRRHPLLAVFDRLAKPWLGRRFFTTLWAVTRFLHANRRANMMFAEGDSIGLYVAMARRFFSFRWTITLHDTLYLPIALDYPGRPQGGWQARAKMWVLHSADRVRANSPVTRDALVEAGIPEARLCLVPLHIPAWMSMDTIPNPRSWRRACRENLFRRLDLVPESRLLVTMSRLTPVKGLELAVEALAASQTENTVLLICGGDRDVPGLGSYSQHLQAIAERCGVGARVRFASEVPIEEVKDVLAAADLHLAPSLMDTFNYAVVEAALVETPSLMSNKVGAGRWIAEIGGGEVISGRDKDLWGRHIAAHLRHPPDMEGVSARCAARFDAGAIAAELLATSQAD